MANQFLPARLAQKRDSKVFLYKRFAAAERHTTAGPSEEHAIGFHVCDNFVYAPKRPEGMKRLAGALRGTAKTTVAHCPVNADLAVFRRSNFTLRTSLQAKTTLLHPNTLT